MLCDRSLSLGASSAGPLLALCGSGSAAYLVLALIDEEMFFQHEQHLADPRTDEFLFLGGPQKSVAKKAGTLQ